MFGFAEIIRNLDASAAMDRDLEASIARVAAASPGAVDREGAILGGYSRGGYAAPVIAAAELPRLSRYLPALYGSAANLALLLALALCALCAVVLTRTAPGFALRALGQGREAARVAGMVPERAYVWIMAASGALAGLGGANFVLGYKGYYEDGFAGGVGFMGIAVAVLGLSRPLGVLLAALLFGTLSQGGLAINALVPREMIDVLTAVAIAAMAASTPAVRAVLRR